jgi:methyl-accepting chemotaxis protein
MKELEEIVTSISKEASTEAKKAKEVTTTVLEVAQMANKNIEDLKEVAQALIKVSEKIKLLEEMLERFRVV